MKTTFPCSECSKTFKGPQGLGAHRKWHALQKDVADALAPIDLEPRTTDVIQAVRHVKFLAKELGGLDSLRDIVAELMDSA